MISTARLYIYTCLRFAAMALATRFHDTFFFSKEQASRLINDIVFVLFSLPNQTKQNNAVGSEIVNDCVSVQASSCSML